MKFGDSQCDQIWQNFATLAKFINFLALFLSVNGQILKNNLAI